MVVLATVNERLPIFAKYNWFLLGNPSLGIRSLSLKLWCNLLYSGFSSCNKKCTIRQIVMNTSALIQRGGVLGLLFINVTQQNENSNPTFAGFYCNWLPLLPLYFMGDILCSWVHLYLLLDCLNQGKPKNEKEIREKIKRASYL